MEFPFIPDEEHPEEEKEVGRVGGLEVEVEFGIHELDKVVEGQKLSTHAGLVAEEVSFLRRISWIRGHESRIPRSKTHHSFHK
jgi:hypothetical protein